MIGHPPDAGVDESDVPGDLSIDVLIDLLADARRGHVFACLRERSRPIAVSDLAADVAASEAAEPRPESPQETVEAISTSLYHVHLPTLAAAVVVEYDRDHDVVAAPDAGDSTDRIISFADASAGIGERT